MRIAICDDDIRFTSKIEDIINRECEEKDVKAEIDIYFDGESLVRNIENGERYNLILLDIEMKKMDGITAARNIRLLDKSALIIYISGYDEYLKELFEVEPFRFVSKPLQVDKLKEYCAAAIKKIEEMDEYYTFSYNKTEHRVPIKNIVYFESSNRLIMIHLNDGAEETFYGKLNGVEKEIEKLNKHFIRIHQSFLVNYSYIKKMTFSEIMLMHNKEELVLKISEERRSFVRRKICEIAGGNATK